MKNDNLVHSTFTIERSYAAAPERVFAAWADPDVKARWFIGPPDRWSVLRRELDLRVGGTEILEGQLKGGAKTLFVARYHVVVPGERLVYAYDMRHADTLLSVSLSTLELERAGAGTRMLYTEQGAFFDGEEGARSRRDGTAAHFDRLASALG